MRVLRVFAAAALVAVCFIGQAGSAAAYTTISETGMVGPWSFTDTNENPGGTCGYSQEYPPNSAFFRWMTIRPPMVMAADTTAGRDHARVTWWWKLQRATWDGTLGPWETIKKSNKQTALAYDDEAAHLSAMRINHSIGTNYNNPYVFGAVAKIQWKNDNGMVKGTAQASIDYYLDKYPWGPYVSGRPFCGGHVTSG